MKTILKHIYRHLFLYSFLLIQAAFLIWVIAGVGGNASGQGASVHAQAVSFCANGGWDPLYNSQADCVTQYGNTLNAASDVGTSIGAGLIIGLWVALDVVLLLGRVVVLLTRRSHKPRTERRPDVVGVDDFTIVGGGSPRHMRPQTSSTLPSDFSSLADD